MSVKPETSWSLWCDWPECDYQFEDGDYSIFGNGYDPDEIVTESGGHLGVDGKHYCHKHPATWTSDHEAGEPFPEAPFLLIHDSDNSGYDDGTVTFIEVTP